MPTTPQPSPVLISTQRLGKWFAFGFAAAYLIMLFLSVSYWDGQRYQQTGVWHFYLLMASDTAFAGRNVSEFLGCQTGQIVYSAVAGMVVMGIVWIRSQKTA